MMTSGMPLIKRFVPIPPCAIGSVIGRGGRTLASMQQQTGVTVEIDEDANQAVLSGMSDDQVHRAEQIILDIIEKWKQTHQIKEEMKSIISIPEGKAVGRIIGKRGSTINKIRQTTGAGIEVKNREKQVLISGTYEQKAKAEEQIHQLLKGENELFKGATEVEVPDDLTDLIAYVIGTDGYTLKGIEEATSTRIIYKDGNFLIKGENSEQEYKATMRIIHIASNQRKQDSPIARSKRCTFVDGSNISEDNTISLKLVEEKRYKLILNEEPQTDQENNGFKEETESIISIPEGKTGRIIGRKGSTMKKLRQTTGASMWVENTEVLIVGTDEQKARAEEQIHQVLEGANNELVPFDGATKLKVPDDLIGLVIGKDGDTLKRIMEATGTKIKYKDGIGTFLIKGESNEQENRATIMIKLIVGRGQEIQKDELVPFDGATKVIVPAEFIGLVIGKGRDTLKQIMEGTSTKIINRKDGTFLIKGENSVQEYKAKMRIKQIVSNQRKQDSPVARSKRCTFVDESNISEDNTFSLKLVQENLYKLILNGKLQTDQESESPDEHFDSTLLDLLGEVHREKGLEEGRHMAVDMWCHFGKALVKGVYEEHENQMFNLREVRNNFMGSANDTPNPNATWGSWFSEGLEKLQVNKLESCLSKKPFKVPPNVRYDFSFLTPSCRQIRMKSFSAKNGEEDGDAEYLNFYDDAPVTMKNVLVRHVTRDGNVNFYLCAPYCTWATFDIIMPSLQFDCRLMVRTYRTDLAVIKKEPEQEEEERVLIDYLTENLVWKDRRLELSRDSPLPDGFDLQYWRRCDRRSYPYSCSGQEFEVMISEEECEEMEGLEGLEPGKCSRPKTDIHLHCDEWDRRLLKGDWEPQEIVNKLPAFLRFVRNVQQYVHLLPDEEIQDE